MARKRKHEKPPPPAETADWTQYQPHQARYWWFGGPYIEPDDIPPDMSYSRDMGAGYAKVGQRVKYVEQTVASTRQCLPQEIRDYVGLHTHGLAALPGHIREARRQAIHTCNPVVEREPDPVSEYMAIYYRRIALSKGRIAGGEATLLVIAKAENPLFADQF